MKTLRSGVFLLIFGYEFNKGLYISKSWMTDFLVLKLFPGDPILDPPISGIPYLRKCDRVSLNWGGPRVF